MLAAMASMVVCCFVVGTSIVAVEAQDPPRVIRVQVLIPLHLPLDIEEDEFDRYVGILGLDDDSVVVAQVFFEQHQQAARELRKRLSELSAATLALAGRISEERWTATVAPQHARIEERERLVQLRQVLVREHDGLDRKLIAEIVALAPAAIEQESLNTQLLTHRRRESTGRSSLMFLPWARIDLIRVARNAGVDVLTDEAFTDVAREYENAVVNPMWGLASSFMEDWAVMDRTITLAFYSPAGEYVPAPSDSLRIQLPVAVAANRKIRARRFRIEERIGDVNRRFATRFALLLSDDQATTFWRLYNRKAFFEVYPDPGWLRPLLEAAQDMEGLEAAQSEELTVVATLYDADHGRANREMERAVVEYKERVGRGDVPGNQQSASVVSFNDGLDALKAGRQEINTRYRARIRAILGEEKYRSAGKKSAYWLREIE